MNYTIAFHKRAVAEYEQIVTWYGLNSQKAAEGFEAAINERMELLRTVPERYKQTYKHFREVNLKTYPYSIVYFIDEDEGMVIIFSIFHHKRNPKQKYRRNG